VLTQEAQQKNYEIYPIKKLKIPKNNQTKKKGKLGGVTKKKLLKSENWIMI